MLVLFLALAHDIAHGVALADFEAADGGAMADLASGGEPQLCDTPPTKQHMRQPQQYQSMWMLSYQHNPCCNRHGRLCNAGELSDKLLVSCHAPCLSVSRWIK